MVRKLQKTKTASQKSSNVPLKKATTKKEKLSNGYEDGEKENEINGEASEIEMTKTTGKIVTIPEDEERLDSVAEEDVSTSQKAPKPRKRRAVETVKEEKKEVKTKAKKQKIEDVSTSQKAPKYRKRKVIETVKEEKKVKTKAKKQKTALEITKRSTIPGKVFVIGENDVGQLGLGDGVTDKQRPALLDLPHSIVDIAAGGMHSVCLTESGEVITFGCNDEGALGRITSDEEGSEYIPKKVDISERIVQVSAGDSHSAALSESGQVYIWGNFRNNNGSMGLITADAIHHSPVKILQDIIVVKIASGSHHLACLSQEGVVYTCGSGETGQLGRVTERASVDGGRRGKMLLLTPDVVSLPRSRTINNIWTGSYTTFVNIKEGGSVYGFGLNNYCQLGLENQNAVWKPKLLSSFRNSTWSDITGGQHHTVTLDDNGKVYSLGRSEYGRLGLGENCGDKAVPTEIPLLKDEKCVDVSCGDSVSFAVTERGSVFSWGMGTSHQLGHGNDDDQFLPRRIEGNFYNSWEAFKISGGGQHTLILAHPRKSAEKK